jgi:Xaa-Pro aminopeptidase
MPPLPDFEAHRNSLLAHLAEDEAVLLIGAPTRPRNGDAEYRYRADSDVYWLTGWADPEVVVFLRPGDESFTLFCQPKDKEREIWDGFRPGTEGARAEYGAHAAFHYDKLGEELPRLLQGVSKLHYAFAKNPDTDALLMGAVQKAARAARKNGLDVPETFHTPSKLLHELRLIKSDDEIAVLREAARLTDLAHRAAMSTAAPGVTEYEIESLIDFTFRRNGGNGAGYTSIVAGGTNACVLHYITNRDELVDGDLLLIDAGCEYANYTADVTRTFPVNGTFTEAQRTVYQWVLDAQLAAIDAARPGRPYADMHAAALRVLTEGLVAMGFLEGDIDELIEKKAFHKYYMHGTGHWLGLDVHDVGAYSRGGGSRPLEKGMVVTVEPGLYIAADDVDAPEQYRGIGIRIEDDVLITDGDPDVLTGAIPKTIAEVEAACRAT